MPLHRAPIIRELVQWHCTLRICFFMIFVKLMHMGCNGIAPNEPIAIPLATTTLRACSLSAQPQRLTEAAGKN